MSTGGKKSLESNDCDTEPIVQVCPEDIGKFKIPELPIVPTIFTPKNFEPIIIPRLPDPPAPETFCNKPVLVSCPTEVWLDADWAEANLEDLQIVRDEFGGVSNFDELNIDPELLPEDPLLYTPAGDSLRKFGPFIDVGECAFVGSTQEEANKKAKLYALTSAACQFCSPKLEKTCEEYQELALPIGGIGYTEENTTISIEGDGSGAQLSPVINEVGTILSISIDEPGDGYKSVVVLIEGDGVGAAIDRVILEDNDCGGPITEVRIGQTLPDPGYDPEVDPPILSKSGTVCLPECAFTSPDSQEDADEQAELAAYAALDCSYQSPELVKPCLPPTVPKAGYNLPLGAFKAKIDRGTQADTTKSAQDIIDALDCIEIPCPDGFPEAIVSINIYDPNDGCNNNSESTSTNSSWFDANFDEENCAYRLDGFLELPEIPCPCGFETNAEIDGMSVTVGNEPNTNANSECTGTLDLGINIVGNTECNFEFDMNTCQFDLDIQLPNLEIECTEISMEITGGAVTAEIIEADEFDISVTTNGPPCVSGSNCGLELELPNVDISINVPCPDGMNATVEITGGKVGRGESATAPSADFTVDNCSFDLEIDLPDIDLACADGFDVEISGGCIQVIVPNTEPCMDEDIGANVSACLSEDRSEPENEGWSFGDALPEKFAPTGVNPAMCVEEGDTVTFEIPPHPDGGNDTFVIGDPWCQGLQCDDRIPGGGNLTVVDIGDEYKNGTIKLHERAGGNNVIKLYQSTFNIGEGGTVTFVVPNITQGEGDGEGRKSLYYYSSENPEGMVGELQIVEAGVTCDISGGEKGCGDCSTGGESGGVSSPSAEFDPESCSLTIELPDLNIELPEPVCPCGVESTSTFNVTGGKVGDVEPELTGNVELSLDNCSLDVSVDLVLPDIDIACPEGFTTSGSGTITGGSFNGGEEPTVTVDVEIVDCALDVSIDLDLPDIDVECANGYSTNCNLEVTGGELTTTSDIVTVNSTPVNSEINIVFENCELILDGTIELPTYSVDVNIPNIACINGITASNALTVTGGNITTTSDIVTVNSTPVNSEINIVFEDCEILLDGTIELPTYSVDVNIPNIACINGITASNALTVTGGNITTTSDCVTVNATPVNSSINIAFEDCEILLDGAIELPSYVVEVDIPNIACTNGITATGSVEVTGGELTTSSDIVTVNYTAGNSEINIAFENCEILLDGAITLPTYSIDVNIPDIACTNGISASGTVNVTEGTETGGSITLASDNCNITLEGEITIGSTNVPDCANIEGALCEDDYTETTLSVCDSSGETTQITVLTRA